MKLGLCPKCHRRTVEYSQGRLETLECVSCGWFTNSASPNYTSTHEQAFRPTLSERADRRLANTFLLAGLRLCGTRQAVNGQCERD